MPNLAQALKEEISRIARKESKAITSPLRRPSIRLRKDVSKLKKRMAALEAAANRLQAFMAKAEAATPVSDSEQAGKGRITAKGIRSLRKRLGLSQCELGQLLGVTNITVGNWERQNGALKVRKAARAAILTVRGIGAKEARKRLAETEAKKVSKPAAHSTRRGKRGKRAK